MKNRARNGTVVDADVARASADPSNHHRALTCARALDVIRKDTTLCIVFEPRLLEEWRAHQSRYARGWLRSMLARRRVRRHEAVPAWRELRGAVERLTSRAQGAAQKDLHLIELARHDGWRIVSLDGKARAAFVDSCLHCPELGGIAWADPATEATLRWLEGGAALEAAPRLGD